MSLTVEVISRFEQEEDCGKLLYAPLSTPLTFRRSRVYLFEFDGEPEEALAFARKVLVDTYSQDTHIDGAPFFPDCRFYLDYGMKPGALDLEKEAILAYYRGLGEKRFVLNDLIPRTRVYVFGEPGTARPEPFLRDVVNPAIHTWTITNSNGRD